MKINRRKKIKKRNRQIKVMKIMITLKKIKQSRIKKMMKSHKKQESLPQTKATMTNSKPNLNIKNRRNPLIQNKCKL